MLTKLSPADPFYNYAECLRLQGSLDPQRLRQAVTAVFNRHDVLRATFLEQAGEVRQKIGPKGSGFDWQERDLRGDRETISLDDYLRAAARTPFDLEAGPLTRIRFLRISEHESVLLVVQHHIISDRSSMQLFWQEVTRIYRSPARGEVSVEEPVMQYVDHVAKSRAADPADRRYWTEKLAGAAPLLSLPTDSPRPNRPSHEGRVITREYPPELARVIHQAARTAGVTTYVYLLSAYLVLLRLYSGQDDISIGAPISSRSSVELERTIGFFNDTVVLRNRVRLEQPFSELLQTVSKGVLEAYAHRNQPFEDIVKELNPERHPGANPLFQTMFLLNEKEGPPDFGAEVIANRTVMDLGVTKFDLTLAVTEADDRLLAGFEYATELFSGDRIGQMLDHYQLILKQLSARPATNIREVRLISGDASQWPDIYKIPFLPDLTPTTVDRQIAEVATTNPKTTALSFGDHQVSYQTLDRRANALAANLLERGIRPGDIVGLHVGRGVDMIVGIYGILKSGAAYLPLDLTYPLDRRRYMLRDSEARWVVTSVPVTDLQLPGSVTVVEIDRLGESPERVRPATHTPTDPAYLIYTSGSSGQPKGIAVSHANLYYSTMARSSVYDRPPESFLLMSSFSFDSSVAGIFWTLTTGGKLVLLPDRAEQDMSGLSELIAREAVTHTLMLPSLYQQLLRFGNTDKLASLTTVIVAGEACAPSVARYHFTTVPRARLYNEYGPTETTVWASVHEVTKSDAEAVQIPIGRPAPYYRIYLIDEVGRLLPPGLPGELCIAGPGLTGGYHKRPELTAQKFGELTLPDGNRVKVYHTGDLAAYGFDGALRFLGRKDSQVKVRGYRVELSEVRKVLLHDPNLTEAEVFLSENGQQLVAYVVGGGGAQDAGKIRDRIAAELPAYMVPASISYLDGLPRLPNGKIDRKTLLASGQPTPDAAPKTLIPPASPEEDKLLTIWREVLGQEDTGVTDNFFSLGGDSLLSIKVLARARRAGLQLPAAAIFEHQTVRELARVALPIGGKSSSAADPASGPVEITPFQLHLLREKTLSAKMAFRVAHISVPADADQDTVSRVVGQLAARHAALRLNFYQAAGVWCARIASPEREVMVTEVGTTATEYTTYLEALANDIDLANDPLFRVVRTDDENTLLLVAHELLLDEFSWDFIIQDLTAQLNGQGAMPIHASYRQAVARLTEQSVKGDFNDQMPFWRKQRATVPPPGAAPQSASASVQTHTLYEFLDEQTTSTLLGYANEAYGTRPQEILLTAVLQTMANASGHGTHCLQVELDDRFDAVSNRAPMLAIGQFTIAYPLLFSLRDTTDPAAATDLREGMLAKRSGVRHWLRYLAIYDWGGRAGSTTGSGLSLYLSNP